MKLFFRLFALPVAGLAAMAAGLTPSPAHAAGWTSAEFVVEVAPSALAPTRSVGVRLLCYDGALIDGVPESRSQSVYPGGQTSFTVSWIAKAPRCRIGHSVDEGTTTASLDAKALVIDSTPDIYGFNNQMPSELFVIDRARTATISIATVTGNDPPGLYWFEFRVVSGKPRPSVQASFACPDGLLADDKTDYGQFGGFVRSSTKVLEGTCAITIVAVAPRPPDLRTYSFLHQGRALSVEFPAEVGGQAATAGSVARIQVPLSQATQILLIPPDPPLPAGPATRSSILPGEAPKASSSGSGSVRICIKVVGVGKKSKASAVSCPKKAK